MNKGRLLRWVCKIKCLECLKCPSAWMPKYLSALRVTECPSTLSVWVSNCSSSARVLQVPQCPSAQVSWVPKCPKRPSNAQIPQVPKCPSASSAQMPFECLKYLSAQVLWVSWVPKWLSQSFSQSARQSADLQCWFSKLISTLRAHTLREDIILRLRKLPAVV